MNTHAIWAVKTRMALARIFGRPYDIIYNMYNLFLGGKSREPDGVDFQQLNGSYM